MELGLGGLHSSAVELSAVEPSLTVRRAPAVAWSPTYRAEKRQRQRSAVTAPREDVAEVTTRALAEAHGSKYPAFTFRHLMDTGYPVPMYMSYQQCEEIVKKLLPAAA